MVRRTTIEIDKAAPDRATGAPTTSATNEEPRRGAAAFAENEREEHSARQRNYLKSLATWADPDVLASDEMWRWR